MAKRGKPKHDWEQINQSYVARPPEEAQARTKTQAWLAHEENIERLLEAVSSGQSVRRFCEFEGIAYSPVQRRLTSDDLRGRYEGAQSEQAEHLLGEMERISGLLEAGEMDPKVGGVIMDSLKWRIQKLNQRKYSDRQVLEQHTYDHTKLQLEAVRQLARRPIEARLVSPTGEAPSLPAPAAGAQELSTVRTGRLYETLDVQVEQVEQVEQVSTIPPETTYSYPDDPDEPGATGAT